MDFNMPHFELPFFTNLLILLVVAKVFGEIFERFKQPAMIGEIIAGIIVGPSLLNIVHRTEDIKVISELGIFLLVIIAGLEINLDDILKSLKGRNIIISLMAFFVPILSGIAVGYYFDKDIMTTVFIGLCVAITALPVSIRILMDLGKINSYIGQKIISVAIFDDVIALTILGLILNINDSEMTLSNVVKNASISLLKLTIFVVILFAAYYLIKKLSNRENYFERQLNKLLLLLKGKESLYAIFFVFVLTFSTITESLGLHFIIGAFFAAMLISENLVGKKHLDSFHKTTNGLAMGFLAPIFFAGIGLEFNVTSIQNIGLLLTVIAVSYFSKIFGGYFGGRMAGLDSKNSLTLGIGLNARGIMELVIANIAYKAGLINAEVFSILVIMGVLTTLSTPIMLKRSFKLIDKKS
ncbi:cation:proton antiporter [Cloacibacterium normanense]|uniref:Sodium/hydrogen exchanger family protein n=2 Tax=Cloacibacterium normanense TaxID=237258 RepID=A0A1E5UD86_9FLAO|nr:cation:proton antiporter [Cloacibacterium normanense]OEL10852.1 sodium/hydrogen exchanger family protein [Cloacibacterium normanense]SDO45826.1 Kef-type K+ transport system, membrane component KefB [Cloacibacterium normanense]